MKAALVTDTRRQKKRTVKEAEEKDEKRLRSITAPDTIPRETTSFRYIFLAQLDGAHILSNIGKWSERERTRKNKPAAKQHKKHKSTE